MSNLDEKRDLHPLIEAWLDEHGYQYECEVKMPEYGRADFVAISPENQIVIIEAKKYGKTTGYRGIAQVVDYCRQYGKNAKPWLALPENQVNAELETICAYWDVYILVIPVVSHRPKRRKNQHSWDVLIEQRAKAWALADEYLHSPEKVIQEIIDSNKVIWTHPLNDLWQAYLLTKRLAKQRHYSEKSIYRYYTIYKNSINQLEDQEFVQQFWEIQTEIEKRCEFYLDDQMYVLSDKVQEEDFNRILSNFKKTRREFLLALKTAIPDASLSTFRYATKIIYWELWKRTPKQLRDNLKLVDSQSLRHHFNEYAMLYISLAEQVATIQLGDVETVDMQTAMKIVYDAAKLISKQAQATSKALGIDLITQRPLLTKGK